MPYEYEDDEPAKQQKGFVYEDDAPAPTPKPQRGMLEQYGQMHRNALTGMVRGAGSIGATLLAPIDMASDYAAGKGLSLEANRERRRKIDEGLRDSFGAETDSLIYKGGKLAGEVAGTAGAGGVLANGARAAGAAPALTQALSTGGFRAAGLTGLRGIALRAGTGAAVGGASAGLANPEDAGTGAIFGGALPGAVKLTGAVGSKVADGMHSGARRLMQSAIKPTIAQLKSGEAATAVDTLLKYGINPTMGGVGKIRGLVDDLNNQISGRIAGSTAQVDKSKVLARLGDVQKKFGNQVSPTSDLKAIQATADDFLGHPNLPGAQLPVSAAQELKQGTYRVLAKKYGQMGSAEVEAQKALARGLKDEIAEAVPGIGKLNAEESRLLATMGVAERRALMEMNKNPMGLASLAHNPVNWAMFMADKSALFKSLAARMVNSSAGGVRAGAPQLGRKLTNPVLRSPLPLPLVRGDAE